MKGIRIRPWEPTDREQLKVLVRQYLEEESGGDFVADSHNVDALTDLGLTWATAGDPCLVACEKGKAIAFTLWGPILTALHMHERVLHGIGTYVSPEYRGRGLMAEISRQAFDLAGERGYDRVDGCAHDQRGWRANKAVGFECVGYILCKRLKQPEERAA